jgi:hypothetical protein
MPIDDVGQKRVDFLPGGIGDGPDGQKGQAAGLGCEGDGGGFQVKHRLRQVEDLVR